LSILLLVAAGGGGGDAEQIMAMVRMPATATCQPLPSDQTDVGNDVSQRQQTTSCCCLSALSVPGKFNRESRRIYLKELVLVFALAHAIMWMEVSLKKSPQCNMPPLLAIPTPSAPHNIMHYSSFDRTLS